MSDADSNATSGGSRKRQPNACNYCRRRKVRCDSATRGGEACSNCTSMKIDCLHTVPRKKRGPPAGRSAQLKSDNIKALTESILSSVPYKLPEDKTELQQILRELASYIRTLEKQLAMVQMSNSDLGNGSPEPIPVHAGEPSTLGFQDDHDDTDELSETLKKLQFSQSPERYSASNRLMLIKSGITANQGNGMDTNHDVFKRPVFWTIQPWQFTKEPQLPPLIFPPQDLLDRLIDLWFVKSQPYFPLFHRPTFERSVISGLHYHDRHFGETLLAMCALSARHSDDPRTFTHGSPLSAGFMWMQQVNPAPITFSEAPSLMQVQKLILYVMFMQTTSMPYSSLGLTGLGIRLLQDVGAHRKKSTPPTVAGELWKRAFWILNYIDLSLSINLGRPRAMTSDDYDAEFPIECDDEYWEQSGELAFKQPLGKFCQLSYWIHMLKLVGILETVQRATSSVRPRRKPDPDALFLRQQAVIEIDKVLGAWLENIPAELKWDPQRQDTVSFHQSAMLYIMYFFLRMETYRNGLATSPSSLEVCVNSAHSCIHIVEAHCKRDYLSLGPQMLAAIANSGIVLLINIWKAKRLERFEQRTQLAGRLWDTLLNVIFISGLTGVYNLVIGKQSSQTKPHHSASASTMQFDYGIGPEKQFELNSIPPTSTTFTALTSLPSNSFHDPVSENSIATSPYVGQALGLIEADLTTTQQQDWGSSDTMDISQGNWAEYMESVDEVLRSLKPH
ncbi:fungal-specific transcription factor domain-containing protein [Lentinula edodes]|uniref:Fungal-specific transcription factor domain-containing protein n=1 Tax=Lentinula lateritia TaxID=40482 RepID=A0A9W9AXX2_9AGAR|nr:fungal-specific transcription factor domain-containing protein [Lentinula edodes]